MSKKLKHNRKYKSGVFSILFGNEAALRELHYAIMTKKLPADTPVEINTILSLLFIGMGNDVSFAADGRLIVLIEHQSTVNESMPVRCLFYCVEIYAGIVKNKALYRRKGIKIPEPVFIVLYNGTEPYPDHKVLWLSDLYKEVSDLLPPGKRMPALELRVDVYNINEGRNPEMMKRSGLLSGYAAFVGKVRENGKAMPKKKALDAAVKHCIDNDILKSFFEKHGSEVKKMMLGKWNMEDALAESREEAWEEGLEEGEARGREAGQAIGREEGAARALESTAKNALAQGLPADMVSKITGLDIETINSFAPV